jgi:YebC/PmpR family DNA-binding regulatory protein|tara:strand:+ start:1440 stop:2186 length:747 start_codon:yes stop_codon:yes gene_type:complete
MAGHSKWANIQHRKGRQDAKRGKLFTKLIREITVAAKLGGGEPNANPRLRAAIDNGLSNNMTKDTIDRAIKRGAGGDDSGNVDEIRYEGYGPGGVALIVDTMTDNKNRTVAEIRHVFSKFGGNLGTDGSVSYLFTKIGLISLQNEVDEDTIMEAALEGGAEDIVTNDDNSIDIITNPDNLVDVKEAILAAGYKPENTEVTMRASTTNELDKKSAETMIRLLDALEDLDDVQKVYSNAEIPDDILAELN